MDEEIERANSFRADVDQFYELTVKGFHRYGPVVTTLQDCSTALLLVHKAIHGDRKSFKDHAGTVVAVEHVHFFRDTIMTSDGEAVEGIRTVLVDADGSQYSTMSIYAYKALVSWILMSGLPPWPCIGIKICRRLSKMGREYVTCDIVRVQPPNQSNTPYTNCSGLTE